MAMSTNHAFICHLLLPIVNAAIVVPNIVIYHYPSAPALLDMLSDSQAQSAHLCLQGLHECGTRWGIRRADLLSQICQRIALLKSRVWSPSIAFKYQPNIALNLLKNQSLLGWFRATIFGWYLVVQYLGDPAIQNIGQILPPNLSARCGLRLGEYQRVEFRTMC